jgi:Spy/CpxP family protein refolding chaperone
MRLRKGRLGGSRGRRAVAAGLMIVVAGSAAACSDTPTDTGTQDYTADSSDADFSVVFGDLTEGIGLTDDQVAAVRDVMEEHRGRGREAGALWYVAVDLQEILSSDQIAAIEARQEELRSETRGRRGEARGQRGRRDGSDPHRAADGLDLSETQLEQMKEIRESFAPQMEEIRNAVRDGSLTRDEARTRAEAIQTAMHEAMKDILTAEQLALLDERREGAEARRDEMKAQWEERRQAEHAAMIAALGLTDEQVASIEALREGAERPAREEMEARREEHRQALLDVLDDDQEEIWILHGSLSQSFARHRARGRAGQGFSGEGRRGRRASA